MKAKTRNPRTVIQVTGPSFNFRHLIVQHYPRIGFCFEKQVLEVSLREFDDVYLSLELRGRQGLGRFEGDRLRFCYSEFWEGIGHRIKMFENYQMASKEADRTGDPIWQHLAGYYAVASYEEVAHACGGTGTISDDWREIVW